MSFKIGLIGKPNAGKSTLFSAITATEVEIASYPFTTIQPNIGTSFIIRDCPEVLIHKKCTPNHGSCTNGKRLIPVQVVDVPGLIEGASEGKGMGNQFLQSVTDANSLILVFDAKESFSSKDPEGSISNEIHEIKQEIIRWSSGIIERDWEKFAKKADSTDERVEKSLIKKVGYLGIDEKSIHEILQIGSLPQKLSIWDHDTIVSFSEILFSRIKPVIPLGNKADLLQIDELTAIRKSFPDIYLISAEYELALQRAVSHGIIKTRIPPFDPTDKATPAQREVLEKIDSFLQSEMISRPFDILGKIVQDILDLITVYPVYDESTWSDRNGNILPDAFLLKKGSTPLDLAFMVHSEIGEGFIRAIDCKTKMVIGKDHELKEGDVIRIISKTK